MSKYMTIVAVGDGDSNKTELLLRYTRGRQYSSNARFQNSVHNIIVDSVERTVHFVDAETDDDYAMLRREIYETADCILLCYSVTKKSSFKSVYKKWCLEVRKHAPFVPIILIGTDIESRNKNEFAVTTQQGEDLKLLIGAYAFVECSIKHFLGVDDIFIEAVRSTYSRGIFH